MDSSVGQSNVKAPGAYLALSGAVAMLGDLDMGGNDIRNVRFIQPAAGQSLILEDASGRDVITILNNNNLTIAPASQLILAPAGGTIQIASGRKLRALDDVSIQLGTDADTQLQHDTNQANHALLFMLSGSEGNHVIFTEVGQAALDFAKPAASTPNVYIHDGSSTPANSIRMTHTGTIGILHCEAGALEMRSPDNSDKIAFDDTGVGLYGVATVARAAALTAEDVTAINAVYDAVEEAVLNNVRTRLGEVETALVNIGILS